jgi:hypothetical protein
MESFVLGNGSFTKQQLVIGDTTMKEDKKTVEVKTEERRSNIRQTLETMLLEKAIIYFLSMMWLPEWLNQPRNGVPGNQTNRDWMKELRNDDTRGGQKINKSAEKAWNYVLARRRHGIYVLISILITLLCVTLLCTCHVDKEIEMKWNEDTSLRYLCGDHIVFVLCNGLHHLLGH